MSERKNSEKKKERGRERAQRSLIEVGGAYHPLSYSYSWASSFFLSFSPFVGFGSDRKKRKRKRKKKRKETKREEGKRKTERKKEKRERDQKEREQREMEMEMNAPSSSSFLRSLSLPPRLCFAQMMPKRSLLHFLVSAAALPRFSGGEAVVPVIFIARCCCCCSCNVVYDDMHNVFCFLCSRCVGCQDLCSAVCAVVFARRRSLRFCLGSWR
mmetsp:Transcript_10343/g.16935  ORF Transcript_10343/g.16935 Transcript_10343/m.16935 type:complete len:213 (-) Transcript_10343:705-1343(-)